jgi:hypothetical protein
VRQDFRATGFATITLWFAWLVRVLVRILVSVWHRYKSTSFVCLSPLYPCAARSRASGRLLLMPPRIRYVLGRVQVACLPDEVPRPLPRYVPHLTLAPAQPEGWRLEQRQELVLAALLILLWAE